MSMYLFNVSSQSTENDNITIILTCLDANPLFFLKSTDFLKQSKPPIHLSTLTFHDQKGLKLL